MDIRDKIKAVKSVGKFQVDLERMLSKSKPKEQLFRNKFSNGCMVLTLTGVIGNLTLDQFPYVFEFVEIHFGKKYSLNL